METKEKNIRDFDSLYELMDYFNTGLSQNNGQ